MRLVTRQTRAAQIAERWHATYDDYPPNYRLHDGTDPRAIIRQLDALGGIPNPDDVDRIIGNASATDVPQCSECGKGGLPVVVHVGEEPDYEARYCYLCGDCLLAALRLHEGD